MYSKQLKSNNRVIDGDAFTEEMDGVTIDLPA